MALTEKLSIIMELLGAGGVVREMNQVSDASAKLGGNATATGSKFDKLASGLGVSAGALKTGLVTGAAAAGTALVAFGVKSVQAYGDATRAANDFQRTSGASAEQSSLLVAAMNDVGIMADTGAKAMFQLGKRVETSSAKLAEFGITAARDNKGNVDLAATLLDVSDRYRSMHDPAERAAFLTAAFGRSGQDLIPILEKGRQGIEDMFQGARDTGQVFSEDDLKRSREYIETMDALSDSLSEVALVAGKILTPVVAGFAETITDAVGWVESLVGGVTSLADKLNKLSGATDDANSDSVGFGDTLNDFYNQVIRGREATDEVADATGETVSVLDVFSTTIGSIGSQFGLVAAGVTEYTDGLDELLDVTMASTSAQRDLDQARRGLESATQAEADAQGDLNKLLRTGRFDLEAIRDAERSLASARRATGNATRDQAKAQREYDTALANANDLRGFDTAQDVLAEAADNLADANDGVAEALAREADAAAALRTAQAGDPEWQDKLADARQRVRDATQGIADATLTLGQRSYEAVKAHDAEKTALSDKADQLGRVRGEIERIIALHPETLPFLGPTLDGLPAAVPTGGGSGIWASVSGAAGGTTNNVSVNVAGTNADPTLIAKEITWALIP